MDEYTDANYPLRGRTQLNESVLVGDWTIGPEAAALRGTSGRIGYRFHSRDVNLIMRSSAPGTSVSFRVRIDGKRPAAVHRIDVDEQGIGRVADTRMYQLIRPPGPVAGRVFDIEFIHPGVEAFHFTFG